MGLQVGVFRARFIEFEIRIGEAKVNAKGDILVSYEHIKEGPGELQVNGKTLELILDRDVDPQEDPIYPQSLMDPLRPEEGMQVRWQRFGDAQVIRKATMQ